MQLPPNALPHLPRFTAETAAEKNHLAEAGWNSRDPARNRPQAWRLCFTRLRAQPDWLESWLIGWGLLLAWGTFAFLIAPPIIVIPAQATFFTGLFPWILLPLVGAMGRGRCGAG